MPLAPTPHWGWRENGAIALSVGQQDSGPNLIPGQSRSAAATAKAKRPVTASPLEGGDQAEGGEES